MPPLRVAIIGCGSRGRTYARLMAESPGRYELVAGADPIQERLELTSAFAPAGFRHFPHGSALLAEPKLADLVVVATQDADHLAPTLAALEGGYEVLVEKPIATRLADVEMIDRRAKALGRKVITCFVLRFTPFYQAVKEIVDSGRLGRIISVRAAEGVEPWHHSHSFVRGHWSKTRDSTPMIVAKCCHDMDILAWIIDSPLRQVSSYGDLSYFVASNAPEGATARCTDGCPHCGTCPYDSHRYLGDKKSTWLPMVFPDGMELGDPDLLGWLSESPWGRCVYLCDNDAVDHQTVNFEFENEVTATFTMTAFDDGRQIEIFGSEGVLRGRAGCYRDPGETLTLIRHQSPGAEEIEISRTGGGHGGGDFGLVAALDGVLANSDEAGVLQGALRGHQLAFAAEAARISSH